MFTARLLRGITRLLRAVMFTVRLLRGTTHLLRIAMFTTHLPRGIGIKAVLVQMPAFISPSLACGRGSV